MTVADLKRFARHTPNNLPPRINVADIAAIYCSASEWGRLKDSAEVTKGFQATFHAMTRAVPFTLRGQGHGPNGGRKDPLPGRAVAYLQGSLIAFHILALLLIEKCVTEANRAEVCALLKTFATQAPDEVPEELGLEVMAAEHYMNPATWGRLKGNANFRQGFAEMVASWARMIEHGGAAR